MSSLVSYCFGRSERPPITTIDLDSVPRGVRESNSSLSSTDSRDVRRNEFVLTLATVEESAGDGPGLRERGGSALEDAGYFLSSSVNSAVSGCTRCVCSSLPSGDTCLVASSGLGLVLGGTTALTAGVVVLIWPVIVLLEENRSGQSDYSDEEIVGYELIWLLNFACIASCLVQCCRGCCSSSSR